MRQSCSTDFGLLPKHGYSASISVFLLSLLSIGMLGLSGCGQRQTQQADDKAGDGQLEQLYARYAVRDTDLSAQCHAAIIPAPGKGDRVAVAISLECDQAGTALIEVDKAKDLLDLLLTPDGDFTLVNHLADTVVAGTLDQLAELDEHPQRLLLQQLPTVIDLIRYGPLPPRATPLIKSEPTQASWQLTPQLRTTCWFADGAVSERSWHDNAGQELLRMTFKSDFIQAGLQRPRIWKASFADGSRIKLRMSSWGKRERLAQKVSSSAPQSYERLEMLEFLSRLEQQHVAGDPDASSPQGPSKRPNEAQAP